MPENVLEGKFLVYVNSKMSWGVVVRSMDNLGLIFVLLPGEPYNSIFYYITITG